MGFFASFARKKRTVGLDLGSHYVKAAEVDHGGDRPEVVGVSMRELPDGAVVEGEVVDNEAVMEAVRDAVQSACGGPASNVMTAIGRHDVFIKRLEVDASGSADLRDAVLWEAEQHLPFDLEDVEVDFHPVGSGGGVGGTQVLLVVAKRTLVKERIELLTRAGAAPKVMDVEAIALCNALMHSYPTTHESTVALVNVGGDSTNMIVVEGGIPVLFRELPFGLGRLLDVGKLANGRVLGGTQSQSQGSAEASDVAGGEGTGAPPPDTDVSAAMVDASGGGRDVMLASDATVEAAADELADSIERACAMRASVAATPSLARVVLSGGGACIPKIPEALANRMAVETKVANPFERTPISHGVRGGELLEYASPAFFLALGLALRSS